VVVSICLHGTNTNDNLNICTIKSFNNPKYKTYLTYYSNLNNVILIHLIHYADIHTL